jgi:hypothetical protein
VRTSKFVPVHSHNLLNFLPSLCSLLDVSITYLQYLVLDCLIDQF